MTNPKMPISIAASAFFFNIINVNVQAIGIFYFAEYAHNWIIGPIFYLGTLIFFAGMFINIRSDYLIVSLRKEKDLAITYQINLCINIFLRQTILVKLLNG